MAKKTRSTKKTVVVKKKWATILAPATFGGVKIGETYVADPKKTLGRQFLVSVATVTGEQQKQQTLVGFEVTRLEGNDLHTEIREIKLSNAAVKRAVRRKKKKITDSFLIKTKDNKRIRIKPLLVTRFRTNQSVLTQLKKSARDYIARAAQKSDFETLCKDILNHKMQRPMSDSLKKVYPLSFCDIRWVKREEARS